MSLKINGKDILTCTEEDLQVIIDNSDYREDEHIDYKLCFAHLDGVNVQDKEKRAEYKCDICSFANADGGYLIYGIAEHDGCASSIIGIDIPSDDTDKFELCRRNELSGIQPKTPHIKFKFIKLESGKYVVVLYVKPDSYAPYIFLEDNKYYRIYRRSGNRKSVIGYTELKRLFNNSMSLEQSIYDYVSERVNYYRFKDEKCGDRFIYLCAVPETFKDSHYNHNMFLLERELGKGFGQVFNQIGCSVPSIPCADGIHFVPWSDDVENADCYIKNNGIIEACLSLKKCTYNDTHLPWGNLWDKLSDVFYRSIILYKSLGIEERCFLCLSIIGCKGLITDSECSTINNNTGKIDRDDVFCAPIAVEINNDDLSSKALKQLNLIFLLSIGVKHKKELNDLIKELQGES